MQLNEEAAVTIVERGECELRVWASGSDWDEC